MSVRIRLQGKPEDVVKIIGQINTIFSATWGQFHTDYTKRWSKKEGQPTDKIRVYGYIRLE